MPAELIRQKRDGQSLSESELAQFFGGFLAGTVADYQVGAMLMAITLKGMADDEIVALTRLMRDSGERFTWSAPRQQVVDKHSTGGVGDKTSLLLMPLALLEGLTVPMMAGRGLGHTGGTLDKLEAVGWRVYLTPAEARAQVAKLGGVIMGQTEQVTPLDRRLYAMRDVTATVESIPLIVGSILSKKLAEGIGGLVMDVKFGNGAFMQTLPDARALARKLTLVGQKLGLTVRCLLTNMGTPLGRNAGNALEVAECLEILQGGGPADTKALTLALASEMVRLAFPERADAEVVKSLEKHLQNGAALAKFREVAAAQGGDLKLLESPQALYRAPLTRPVVLKATGARVTQVNTRKLGLAVVELGGGRRVVADKIDPWVGLTGMKRLGELVAPGEPVAILHASTAAQADAAERLVAAAYRLGDDEVAAPLIEERTP